MRKYTALVDNGHSIYTVEFYSNHRANSKANFKDCRQECDRKYFSRWSQCNEIIKTELNNSL